MHEIVHLLDLCHLLPGARLGVLGVDGPRHDMELVGVQARIVLLVSDGQGKQVVSVRRDAGRGGDCGQHDDALFHSGSCTRPAVPCCKALPWCQTSFGAWYARAIQAAAFCPQRMFPGPRGNPAAASFAAPAPPRKATHKIAHESIFNARHIKHNPLPKHSASRLRQVMPISKGEQPGAGAPVRYPDWKDDSTGPLSQFSGSVLFASCMSWHPWCGYAELV